MKWIFAGAFAVLMVLSLVAWAIAPKPIEDGRLVLTLVSDPNPSRYEQIDLFNRENPQYALRLDPSNREIQKIIVQAIAGVGPDLFHAYVPSQLSAFVRTGIAWDITDELPKLGVDVAELWPFLDPVYQYDGRVYGYPTNASAPALWLNLELFAEAGVEPPTGGLTWEEFIPLAARLVQRDANGRISRYGLLADWSFWPQFIAQYGGRIYSPDGTRCTIDSPEAQRGLTMLHDLIWKHHLMPTPAEEASLASGGGFGAGTLGRFRGRRAATAIGGRWWLCDPQFRDDASLRLGVVEAPHGTRRVFIGGGKGEVVNRYSPRRAEALAHLVSMSRKPYNDLINAEADGIAPVKRFADTPEFERDPAHPRETWNAVWREVAEHAIPDEASLYIDGSVAMRLIGSQLDWVKSDEKPVAEACREAARLVDAEIARSVARDPALRARFDAARAAAEGGR